MTRSLRASCLLVVLAAPVMAQDLEPRVRELERQVAELAAWRKAQEGQHPAASGRREAGLGIIAATIGNKRFQALDYNKGINSDGLYWDTTYQLVGRDKPVRAIKGELVFADLFGEPRLRIAWTVNDPFTRERPLMERGKGIIFDSSNDNHVWLRAQKESDIKMSFAVRHILYQDGTAEVFNAE